MTDAIVKEGALAQNEFEQFASAFQGKLIGPNDADYEEARQVWNGMIDRYPAVIAQATSREDVVAAVSFARESGIPLSVRGGGHNVAGHGTNDDGLVIDLSPLNRVEVDPVQRTVRAGGGATIAELDEATQRYGLAVPMGVVSATGIAGLTLGGGYGWLRNKYGLSADNLIGAEVVTADGRIVRASEEENFDLLWGLRGGGGNFGIVTEFVYRAYPVGPDVFFTLVFHDGRGAKMKRAIRFYRDYATSASDEVSTLMFTGIIPPEPELFPEGIHNTPYVAFMAMYAGPAEAGRERLSPLSTFDKPLIDFSDVMPYLEAQKILDEDYPDGMRYYWKSLNLTRLDDEVIERLITHARKQPSVYSTVDLWHIGGAVARGSADESAFHGRDVAFLLSPEANWKDAAEDEANINWLRALVADMERFSDGSRYLNFAGFQEEGDELMRKAFGPQYQRLVALKNRYDPTNLFSRNQNIKPAPDAGD